MEDRPILIPVEVKQSGPLELAIVWQDGHTGVYPTHELRLACRCARCADEWTGEVKIDRNLVPEDVHPVQVESVGRYGLRINWSDGHNTGIYSFHYLREICRCAECKKQHDMGKLNQSKGKTI